MRENLNKMARAGQGKDINDESVSAFFADDVPSLMTAIQNAIMFIETHEEQTGKGQMLKTPLADDILNQNASQYDFYSSTFRIRRDNVWEGRLTRFSVDEDPDGIPAVRKIWELNDKLLSKRNGSQGNSWRNITQWDGRSLARIPRDSPGFASFTGLSPDNMSDANLPGNDSLSGHGAALAFYDWLNGYEHSYQQGKDFKRANILADLGQQGVVMVSDPPVGNGPPGYNKWAEERNLAINKQPPMIYLQTNDGILHAVEPDTGNETMAIIPPPMLLPSRLATMKTRVYGGGKLNWLDVNVDESDLKNGDITNIRANPVYLLDGALISRRMSNRDGSLWGTYLFGALGRGGSGLYAMNADSHSNPRFLWYKEKIGTELASMTASETVPSLSVPAQDSSDMFWMKLGLNSPKPVPGVTGAPGAAQNFIALTGGFEKTLNLSLNGRDGAVLMLIDPEDGSVIRGFGSGEVERSMRKGKGEVGSAPYMGMMISEPTLLRSEQGNEYGSYMTGAVYAADNRGSIFGLEMEQENADKTVTPISPKEWKLKTLATLQSNQELSAGSGNSYAIPHGITALRKDNAIWLSGGTADIPVTRDHAHPDGKLYNASQMIFSFKTEQSQTSVYTRNDLKVLRADETDVYNPEDAGHGWMINLAQARQGKSAEYVSAKPLVAGGVIYIPTFVEKKINITNPDILCNFSPRTYGEARLYALHADSGAPYWGEPVGRFSTIDGIKITGFSSSNQGGKTRIVATYDNLTGREPEIDKRLGAKNVKELSSFMIDQPTQSTVNMEPGQDMIYYWKKD
jgi:type IV pilus assembly protein PilY1